MNWLVFAIVGWVMFGLELGMADALQLGVSGIAPSFVMILLVVVAASTPRNTAIWAAIAIGLFLDLTHKAPSPAGARPIIVIGPYVLACLMAAYTVLTMRAMVFRRNVLAMAFLSMFGAAMAGVVVTAVYAVRHFYDGQHIEIHALPELGRRLASAVYTGAIAIVVAPALQWLAPLFGFPQAGSRERRRRA